MIENVATPTFLRYIRSVKPSTPESASLQDESPETPETLPETAAPEPDRSLADLLAEADTPPPERAPEGEAAERQPQKPKPLKALNDLAERLELTPDKLYAVEVPLADGKSMTIGQLKDAATAASDLETERFKFEESKSQRESDLLRAQNELQELIAALPKEALKPQVVQAVRDRHDAVLKRERARTLEVIPEWVNDERREQELAGMVEWLKGYGFPANYLQTVYDHRAIRFMRDNWLRAERVRKALEKVQKQPPAAQGKSKPNGRAPAKPGAPQQRQSPSAEAKFAALLD